MKNEEFENIRARNICKANSGKSSRKIPNPESNFSVVKTGNRKLATGNQNHKTGPEGFEPSTFTLGECRAIQAALPDAIKGNIRAQHGRVSFAFTPMFLV